jgi:glycosyltransferase involved in cell wall biosynthesis
MLFFSYNDYLLKRRRNLVQKYLYYKKQDASSIQDLHKFLRKCMKLPLDGFLHPEYPFLEQYDRHVILGKQIAADSRIAVVALARNCEKKLKRSICDTQKLVCDDLQIFVFENDSIDGTKQILNDLQSRYKNIVINNGDNGSPHLQDRSRERTKNLAKYRNICLNWVKDKPFDYVIVLDLDADIGFSINGIYNSISWLNQIDDAAGMGSYSFLLKYNSNYIALHHYDTFAMRLNDWKPSSHIDNNSWFKKLHPIIGSNPFHLYSCFGGLAVYKHEIFVQGHYSGTLGCEHVYFHKCLYEKGYKMYLNPSSIFFAICG